MKNLNYKIDYKLFVKKSDYISYLALFEDAGWKHICGSRNGANHYFLPKNDQVGSEIFSDAESANKRYQTLFQVCLINFITLLVYGYLLLAMNHFRFQDSIFLTPNLWEKVGVAFWKSFLLELPFAVGRIGIWMFLVVMSLAYGYWTIKSKKEYDRYRREKEKINETI